MAHKVAIINGKAPSGGVGGVTDADLMNLAINFLSKGVVGANDYLVQQQGTPNMSVLIGTGKCYLLNGAASMMYLTNLDATINVSIASNSSGNPRIDAIVLKVDTGVTPDNTASNVATVVAVQGAPAASPSAPSDSAIQTAVGAGNSFYRLANVTVANGAASITTANIASTRAQATLSGGSSGCSVYLSANQTVTNGVTTTVTFNTEEYDLGGEFSSNKFTAITDGKYLVAFTPILQSLTAGKVLTAAIYKNGSLSKPAAFHSNSSSAAIGGTLSAAIALAAGDYIEFKIVHDDTVPRDLVGGATSTNAQIHRLP